MSRLQVVSGKGGTGKTTVAAAIALALATEGKRTLLVEVEGRQGIEDLTRRLVGNPRRDVLQQEGCLRGGIRRLAGAGHRPLREQRAAEEGRDGATSA